MMRIFLICTLAAVLNIIAAPVLAHHVLGRPTYSLNENTNTPPSMQVETQIGKYFVTIMAFPAFPQPNEQGRVHLYASRIDSSQPLTQEVTFTVRDDNWFSTNQETLGKQIPIENIYKQGFVFNKEGNYIITAYYQADGEPYSIDFPITIGKPLPIGTIGIFATIIFLALVSINLFQRRKLHRLQASRHQQE